MNSDSKPVIETQLIRLNIGSKEARNGWKILNIQPGPGVDYVGNCTTLGQFADNSIGEIYASHVLEHLSYQKELDQACQEMYRVLSPGGLLRISVPDLDVLCRLFMDPTLTLDQRFFVMRMMFGGQVDDHDFHKVGLSWEFLSYYLSQSGFREIRRVTEFDLFPGDCSSIRFGNQLISLNLEARKL